MRRGTGRLLGFVAGLVRGLAAAVVLFGLLAGLPWAMVCFVGWPLPDHLPSWSEVQGVLLSPMTTVFLLDVLACAGWVAWARFAFDIVRCTIQVVRGLRLPDPAAAGPVRRIGAVLVGAVLISLLGHRTGFASTGLPTSGIGSEVVLTVPAWHHPATREIRPAARPVSAGAAVDAVKQPVRAKSAVVLPYDPVTGLYDSLWRMAERTLGDGERWPEIFELNKGKPQAGGGTFTRPSLIHPGEEMALPDDATVPTAPTTVVAPAPVPQQTPHSTPAPRQSTLPPTRPAPPDPPTSGEVGVAWGEELFVGLGLVSAVSAALVLARRRHRRRYRPGSGDRTDLPVAPVVYQLRLAHLHAEEPDLDEVASGHAAAWSRRASTTPVVLGAGASASDEQRSVLSVGVRDGREIALDLAAVHGLGLIGAGAAAAARALLLTTLTTTAAYGPAQVIVPAEDLAVLLGRRAAQASLLAGVHVVADLDAALDVLEADTLVRTGRSKQAGRDPWPSLVLLARTPERQRRRLQGVLDNGSDLGITGLLLGQWAPGVTAYVRADGTISTTSPGLGEPLRGTRVFWLGDDHTADLLTLLHHAAPNDEPGTGGKPDTHEGSEHTVATSSAPKSDTTPEPELPAGGETPPQASTALEITGTAPTIPPGLFRRPTHPGTTQSQPADAPAHATTAAAARTVAEPVDLVNSTNLPTRLQTGGMSGAAGMPLRIRVLGPPRVWWRGGTTGGEREITAAFQPRVRELLVFLALHHDGASREALIAALWAASPPEKTTSAMNSGLTRLRRAVAAATEGALSDVVLTSEGRYRLDPDLVEVDYWCFAAAVAARRAATTEQQRVEAYRRVVAGYSGPLADGLSTEWIETAREAIRRDAIDAVAALARALVDHDPRQTLDLLEVARAFDPHNELIYRDIMRLQDRLGQLDAIPRTVALLTTRLAEIDDRPTPQTIELAERLRRRHDTTDASDRPPWTDCGHYRAG
ncbi:transcriptional regulator [Saccharothrix syringae]|uniref:Transcriptional regulator n=1 Tax=Saccharothrix syringae TaxID=103733 RepID=A0A5Q0HD80_SACSY|nr:transcriptional regulator [Saccharothrix syringae]